MNNLITPDQHDLEILLPGLGYFGTTKSDCLDIKWQGCIQGVRISIPESTSQSILNLTRLEMHGPEGYISIDSAKIEATQSSIYNEDSRFGPENLLAGKIIHTQPEHAPWWQATFNRNIPLAWIRLFNRGDQWGIRAREICIELLIDNQWSSIYRPRSGSNLLNILHGSTAITGPIRLDCNASTLRGEILEKLASSLLSTKESIKNAHWRQLLSFIDIWGEDKLSDHETTILAAWMTQVGGLHPLLPISNKLKTPESIISLQDRINHIAQTHEFGQYIITRHGVHHSYLMLHKNLFLEGAVKLIGQLATMHYQPMVAYGTLLGAVRNQSFIPHDDDMDLILLCRSRDRDSVEQEMTSIAANLRAIGYRVVQLLPESLNMRVFDEDLGVEFDVFPCWRGESNVLFLHMEKMIIRTIPEHIVLPPRTVTLHGQTLPAPADPEAFLTARYGPSWTTPNQFFEWPWPLSSTP